ncbi:gliding motility-associated ABC transporter permease subunit GldF [Natronoflexus pectinivorans]|uniref:ABC-2 type transport system permease protein n=1 Tax=Natronoflexus pectinivorans TaxID=682526 RepID=A0A4R2GGU0_9BACT|nr:gliding motility-associated ABC transporter permease subunit GldF [Natronoflexus pectinivorans]TCO07321.1 ABC-2 type transport system permease protein [Natronoflexus pectinivorans]
MLALWKKEVMSFFSSLTGYLVAGVFLLMTALFLWVIPGNLNIPFGGYATLDSLFWIAPWLYLFLVPAVTMRLLADEKKSGTIELLMTNPLTDWHIVLGKYLAGVTLVVISLIPTLVYFISVHYLAQPVGHIDHGAIWGSYIGLVLLAAVYASIGLFASALTENQIVSFVIAVVICFFFYSGIQSMAVLPFFRPIGGFLVQLGIDEHYQSISRGVVDSRDLVYFAGIITFFLVLTKTVLGSRKW